jgi:isopenicillin N synthase-like dioxygenase
VIGKHTSEAIEPVALPLNARDPAAFVQALGASFARHGFAVVIDHGLDQARIDAALAAAKAFFALPDTVKRRYQVAGGAGQRGYTPFGIETAKGATDYDLKEFWHVGRELPPGHRLRAIMADNLWPAEVAGFREQELWLYETLEALGRALLAAIARYLNLEPAFFDDATENGNSILRLLHYPPVPDDGPHLRAAAHEDINAITLLLGAEEAGLEILTPERAWLPLNPAPGALVVNIGDMLARLTNDRLPSTTHRVVNPVGPRRAFPRYSTPFFLHFRPDFLIRTLPGCVTPTRPDRYPTPITADDYLRERLRELRLA